MKKKQTVAVVGVSQKADRYSYRALVALKENGHTVIPVAPAVDTIEGLTVVHSLSEIKEPVDTVTLYVGPGRGEQMIDALINLRPKRVIMNPGTESERLSEKLSAAGIEVVQGCTLVMLSTNQF